MDYSFKSSVIGLAVLLSSTVACAPGAPNDKYELRLTTVALGTDAGASDQCRADYGPRARFATSRDPSRFPVADIGTGWIGPFVVAHAPAAPVTPPDASPLSCCNAPYLDASGFQGDNIRLACTGGFYGQVGGAIGQLGILFRTGSGPFGPPSARHGFNLFGCTAELPGWCVSPVAE